MPMGGVFQRNERKDGLWWIRWTENGKKKTKCIGPRERDARDALKIIEARLVQQRGQPGIASCSFADLVTLYRESVMPTLTWAPHVKSILREMTREWGDRRVADIGPRDIEAYRAARLSRLAPSTLNRHLAVVKRLYNLAIEWGVADRNPAARVKKLREENAREEWLTVEEACRLVEAAPDYLRPAILLALNTGARRGELTALKWSEVNFETGTISFLRTKSGRRRNVPISDELRIILEHIPRQGDFVLMRDGKPLREFRTAWKKACEAAGIKPGFRWHDLRHTYASHHARKNKDLATLQRQLGHASVAMTMRYSHLASDDQREAANAFVLGVRPTVREGVVAFRNPISRRTRR
jgi:integrase